MSPPESHGQFLPGFLLEWPPQFSGHDGSNGEQKVLPVHMDSPTPSSAVQLMSSCRKKEMKKESQWCRRSMLIKDAWPSFSFIIHMNSPIAIRVRHEWESTRLWGQIRTSQCTSFQIKGWINHWYCDSSTEVCVDARTHAAMRMMNDTEKGEG